jgi:hypothetical protein
MPRRTRVSTDVRQAHRRRRNSCTILTFATAFRPALLRLSAEDREAQFSRSPSKKRAEYKRDVVARGLESGFVREALEYHGKLLHWIDDAMKNGPYLAGESYSLADVATIPYVLRLELLQLSRLWERYPAVGAWWERVRSRPSFEQAIAKRMTETTEAVQTSARPWPGSPVARGGWRARGVAPSHQIAARAMIAVRSVEQTRCRRQCRRITESRARRLMSRAQMIGVDVVMQMKSTPLSRATER